MNSLMSIKKEVQMLKQILIPKPEDKVVVRMWMPDSDPRQDLTDSELERLNFTNKIVVKPLTHEQCEEGEKFEARASAQFR